MESIEQKEQKRQETKQDQFKSRGGNNSVGYNFINFEYSDNIKGEQQQRLDGIRKKRIQERCNNIVRNGSNDYNPISCQDTPGRSKSTNKLYTDVPNGVQMAGMHRSDFGR